MSSPTNPARALAERAVERASKRLRSAHLALLRAELEEREARERLLEVSLRADLEGLRARLESLHARIGVERVELPGVDYVARGLARLEREE